MSTANQMNIQKIIYLNGAVDKVFIGSALSYSGDVYLYKDGGVTIPDIPGTRLYPGDVIYQITSAYAEEGAKYTTDRAVAISKQASLLDSGAGTGVLDQMIRVSAKINRTVALQGPVNKASNNDVFDSLFAIPAWKKYRYADALAAPTSADIRYAEEIDALKGEHDPDAIKDYLINKWVDQDMKIKIGGYLHLDKTQRITQPLIDAMYAYQMEGGSLGKSALEGIAEFTRDDTALKNALVVYD